MHADIGSAALQAGAHVICTKPLTTTIEDARRLIAAADASGQYLMAAHEPRFTPLSRAIKTVLDQGMLGDLFYVAIDYFDHEERQFTGWPRGSAHGSSLPRGCGIRPDRHLDMASGFLRHVSDEAVAAAARAARRKAVCGSMIA